MTSSISSEQIKIINEVLSMDHSRGRQARAARAAGIPPRQLHCMMSNARKSFHHTVNRVAETVQARQVHVINALQNIHSKTMNTADSAINNIGNPSSLFMKVLIHA